MSGKHGNAGTLRGWWLVDQSPQPPPGRLCLHPMSTHPRPGRPPGTSQAAVTVCAPWPSSSRPSPTRSLNPRCPGTLHAAFGTWHLARGGFSSGYWQGQRVVGRWHRAADDSVASRWGVAASVDRSFLILLRSFLLALLVAKGRRQQGVCGTGHGASGAGLSGHGMRPRVQPCCWGVHYV